MIRGLWTVCVMYNSRRPLDSLLVRLLCRQAPQTAARNHASRDQPCLSPSSSPTGASRFTPPVVKGIREGIAFLLAVLALLLLIALLSYSASDPGFTYSGNGEAVHNRIGPVGALVADVLLFIFG